MHAPSLMKHQLLTILFSLLCFCKTEAQSVLYRAILVNAGMEFGGGIASLQDNSPTAKKTGSTIFRSFPFSFEYGIGDHTGLGIEYRHTEYKNHLDSVTAFSNDFMLMLNYHIISTKQTNSFTGIKAGVSDLKFEKIRNASIFTDKGLGLQIYCGVNMLFLKNMGMQVSFGLNTLLYPNGELKAPSSPLAMPYGVNIFSIDMGMGIFIII